MPPALLLHEPTLPYEPARLVAVLAERMPEVQIEVLQPHRILPTLARLLRRANRPRVVHAFGRRALAMAVTAADTAVVFSPVSFPTTSDIAWVRAAIRYRDVRVVCTSDAERRAWVTGGVPIDRCLLVRPGVSLAMPANARQIARTKLGFGETDRILFTPVPAAGPARATPIWAGCLMNVLDGVTQTLGWSDGGRLGVERMLDLKSRLLTPDAMHVLDASDPIDGLAACDAVMLPPSDFVPPTLIATAMAAGRPIVAHASAQVCEMLEDRHTALLAGRKTANALAARATDVFNDPALARKIADRARAEAYEHFLRSRLLHDYRTLYTALGASASSPSLAAVVTTPA